MVQRIGLRFQIRSLETMIDGREQTLPWIRDILVRANMEYLNTLALSELRRLKRKYCESQPNRSVPKAYS